MPLTAYRNDDVTHNGFSSLPARERSARAIGSRAVYAHARGSRCCRRPRRPRQWWRAPPGRRALRARRGIAIVARRRRARRRLEGGPGRSPARGRGDSRRAPPRRAAPKRRSRRDRPRCCARPEEPGEAPAGGDDAKASAGSDDAEAQFKTGLGSDPAFDAALASVSDMASDAAPRDPAEEKPRELTKEDFVAPSIDWGDTVVRNADASSDDAQAPVTFSAADLAGDAPAAVPPASGSSPSLAERAMAQSAADGFAPAAPPRSRRPRWRLCRCRRRAKRIRPKRRAPSAWRRWRPRASGGAGPLVPAPARRSFRTT